MFPPFAALPSAALRVGRSGARAGAIWLELGPRRDLVRLAGKRFVASIEVEDGAALAATDRAATHSERLGAGYLIFGAAFLVVGPVLIFLALWMRRDVRLVAAKEEKDGPEMLEGGRGV